MDVGRFLGLRWGNGGKGQVETSLDGITFSHRHVGGVRLHVAQAGPEDGPLVILLHGFPEFWFGWRAQIEPLAQAGFRVVVPDQRGYNLSDKPKGAKSYVLDLLAADIFALAKSYGRETFGLVGHDWGAAVAWWMATIASDAINRLAILNAPHPALWRDAMFHDPEQRRKSQYVQMMRMPWLPEAMMRASGFKALTGAFASTSRPEAFGPEAMTRYKASWSESGALTGAVNWYRALFMQDLPIPTPASILPPTLVMWGDMDPFAGPQMAEASVELCRTAQVRHFPHATHWLAHDEPDGVSDALITFLRS